jgi:CXXX repeat modification system protein
MSHEEKVGQITEDEKDKLLKLFERQLALKELIMGSEHPMHEFNNDLYEKIISDMGQTERKLDGIWEDLAQKYNWKTAENGNWNIDFETGDVILVYPGDK